MGAPKGTVRSGVAEPGTLLKALALPSSDSGKLAGQVIRVELSAGAQMAATQLPRVQAKPRASVANYLIWGSLAVCAVLVTSGLIALSVNGGRGPLNVAQISSTRPPAQPVIQKPQGVPEFEMARLQDALRAMAAERERLSARVEQLERSVGDITASINTVKERQASPQNLPPRMAPSPPPEVAATPAPPIAPPAPPPAAIAAAPPSPPVSEPAITAPPPASPVVSTPSAPPPVAAPARPGQITARPQVRPVLVAPKLTQTTRPPVHVPPAPKGPPTQVSQIMPAPMPSAADSVATKTEFGIDLGGETSMDGLRALWANVKGNHGTVLDGMRPLVSVREGQRPGTVELRLIAGPVPNAGTAARVCANLQTTGVACQAAEYDGQKLSLR